MKILLVAATDAEVSNLRHDLMQSLHTIDVLVTGVGMAATAYALTKRLSKNKYDYVINIGLAGSFREEIEIGEVVNVISETFSDLGAQDDKNFLSVFDLGLQQKDDFPFWNGKIKNDTPVKSASLSQLKKVKGITVNTVHGNENGIALAIKKHQPDVESMEGAAVFYVCMMEKIPFLELRSVSNKVEKRDRASWDIPVALENLRTVSLQMLSEIK